MKTFSIVYACLALLQILASPLLAAPREVTAGELIKEFQNAVNMSSVKVGEDLIIAGAVKEVSRSGQSSGLTLAGASDRESVAFRVDVFEVWGTIVPPQQVKVRIAAQTGVQIIAVKAPGDDAKKVYGLVFEGTSKVEDAGQYAAIPLKAADYAAEFAGDPKATQKKYHGKYLALEGKLVSYRSFPVNELPFVLVEGANGITLKLIVNSDETEFVKEVKISSTIRFVGTPDLSPTAAESGAKTVTFFGNFFAKQKN